MDKIAVLKEIEKMTKIEAKYMMGTLAFHQLGDVSSDEPDLFIALNETEENWLGSWVTGFGFFNVVFPKESSRELTPEEIKTYNKLHYRIGSGPAYKLNIPNP